MGVSGQRKCWDVLPGATRDQEVHCYIKQEQQPRMFANCGNKVRFGSYLRDQTRRNRNRNWFSLPCYAVVCKAPLVTPAKHHARLRRCCVTLVTPILIAEHRLAVCGEVFHHKNKWLFSAIAPSHTAGALLLLFPPCPVNILSPAVQGGAALWRFCAVVSS